MTSSSVPPDVSIVKVDIVRELINETFGVSTVIEQSEYVPLLRGAKVILLFPWFTVVVLEEHKPPYVMFPATLEENV